MASVDDEQLLQILFFFFFLRERGNDRFCQQAVK